MENIASQVEAVVDATKPAFENVEGWDSATTLETAIVLADMYLGDNGYEVLAIERRGNPCPYIVARDGEGELGAFAVTARRALVEVTDPLADLSSDGIDAVKAEAEKEWGDALHPGYISITFFSNRIAHIVHAVGELEG